MPKARQNGKRPLSSSLRKAGLASLSHHSGLIGREPSEMSNASHAAGEIHNLTFDELRVGQRASHVRTLTLDDVKAFALVSGDRDPAHVDPASSETTGFHGLIADRMLAGTLISSLVGNELPGAGSGPIKSNFTAARKPSGPDAVRPRGAAQGLD